MVVGHEVIGNVVAVGPKVTTVSVGQRVGYGPQRNSCGSCYACADSLENCCDSFVGLYDPDFGGYATSITVPEKFTFPVPMSIPAEVAGPLLCAGITTFAPLSRNVKPGDKVGIVGIGGLGHMALQYAKAMGAGKVVAITTSASKEAMAKSFGATEILVSSNADAMKAAHSSFDYILCCATGNFEVAPYLKLLKARKSFCLVGLPPVKTPLTVRSLWWGGGEACVRGIPSGSPPPPLYPPSSSRSTSCRARRRSWAP